MIPLVKVGMPVSFVPMAYRERQNGFKEIFEKRVSARIMYVNEAHRYYMAEYTVGRGCKLRECFKF